MRLRLVLVAACVFALAAALGGATWAAFSSQTENSGNTVSTAASFANLAVASGSYTGDGVDDRQVSLPFDANVVIVKSDGAQATVMRTSTMTGDATKPLTGSTALTSNLIQSLPSAAFTVGTDTRVNANGTTYRWTAFKSAAANMKVGTYAGDGAASRTVTGVGFSPDYTIVLGAGANAAQNKMIGMPRSFNFDASTGITNGILGTVADGFQLGNSNQVNASGQTYHYVSFAKRAGSMTTAAYTGNGTDNAPVTGLGFRPGYVIVRASDTATARAGHHRPYSLAATASQFFANFANSINGLKALQADGFQLGTDASVNASGVSYYYAAFKNTATGCAEPSSITATANADAWITRRVPGATSAPTRCSRSHRRPRTSTPAEWSATRCRRSRRAARSRAPLCGCTTSHRSPGGHYRRSATRRPSPRAR